MKNWKEFARTRSWRTFKVSFQHSTGQTEGSQDSWNPGQDLNPGPPIYEGVLTTQPRCSMIENIRWQNCHCVQRWSLSNARENGGHGSLHQSFGTVKHYL